ncbi:hypothetical protein [Ferdinandcohnia sp. SAFN-114]
MKFTVEDAVFFLDMIDWFGVRTGNRKCINRNHIMYYLKIKIQMITDDF